MSQKYAICRFNKNHHVLKSRLLLHEYKCPDSKGKNLKTCVFNIHHKISSEKYQKHINTCPDRPKIDSNLEKKIIQYIKNNNQEESKNENEIVITNKRINEKVNNEEIKKNENSNYGMFIDLFKFTNQEIFNCMDNGIIDYSYEYEY
jgi:hypothetical protein